MKMVSLSFSSDLLTIPGGWRPWGLMLIFIMLEFLLIVIMGACVYGYIKWVNDDEEEE